MVTTAPRTCASSRSPHRDGCGSGETAGHVDSVLLTGLSAADAGWIAGACQDSPLSACLVYAVRQEDGWRPYERCQERHRQARANGTGHQADDRGGNGVGEQISYGACLKCRVLGPMVSLSTESWKGRRGSSGFNNPADPQLL